MRILPVLVLIAVTATAYAASKSSSPQAAATSVAAASKPFVHGGQHLSDAEEKELIARAKSTWRAQTGETVEQIIAKVAKVAHFVPRQWDVGYGGDGSRSVVLSWAKHLTDDEGDEYTISWDINSDGTLSLGPPYAKPMELGWQAFALSLIQSEIDDDEKGANRRFLHDLSNLNFVQTEQGRLGNILRRGKCSLGDPVGVDYVAKLSAHRDGDFFRLQLSVNCDIRGPRYFTRDGVVLFVKRGVGVWQPQSFLAHRIATNAPGKWFDRPDPKEQESWETAVDAFKRAGMPVSESPFSK